VTRGRLRWHQVAAWRASRHHLDGRVPRRRMLDVVSDLCGLHAQVMSSAELTLWARVEGLRTGDLATALWQDRSLVKKWAMRGTLHLFRASEHPLWTAALRTYAHLPTESWGVLRGDLGADGRADRDARGPARRAHPHPRGAGPGRDAPNAIEAFRRSDAPQLGRDAEAGLLPGCAVLRTGRGSARPVHGSPIVARGRRQRARTRRGAPRGGAAVRCDERPRAARRGRSLVGGRLGVGRREAAPPLGDDVVEVDVEGLPAWALAAHARAPASAEPGPDRFDCCPGSTST
jgi:hypothetical protein